MFKNLTKTLLYIIIIQESVAGHFKHQRKEGAMQAFFLNVSGVFFGTVRRAQWTIGVLAVFYFALRPGDLVALVRSILHGVILPVLHELVVGLAQAVGPLMGSIITILLVIFGFRLILRGVRR